MLQRNSERIDHLEQKEREEKSDYVSVGGRI